MVRIHPDPPAAPARPAGVRSAAGRGEAMQHKESRQRGCSSVGRAPALQAGGRRFDPVRLHISGIRGQETGIIRDQRSGDRDR